MAIEIEIKIEVKSPRKIRQKIISLGAKFLGKQRELDVFFGTGDEGFRRSDQVRRLRLKGEKATLAYKGPREICAGIHKRIEIETPVENFEKMRTILVNWGHNEGERSEKIRETFEYKGAKILIDKVAFIGWWIELEGKKERS